MLLRKKPSDSNCIARLEEQLSAAVARTDRADERIGSFIGGADESREAIKRAFNEYPEKSLVRAS